MQVKELFDSIAPQNAEIRTVANSLPLFLKYSVKCLFFKRLYQTIENLKYKTVKWKRRMPKNIMTDAEVKLTGYLSEKKYPESLRLVRYYDEEDNREFTFLTNAKQLSALDVANLYKKRWLIELFFKWLKQHLKIKKFWGTTENAVRIQISVAIITYCLVAIVQHDVKLKRSTYEVLQILSISLTDKTHLHDLFDKTNFNDVKDLNDPLIPGLFD